MTSAELDFSSLIHLGADGLAPFLSEVTEDDAELALSAGLRDASSLLALVSPAADRLRHRMLLRATRLTRKRHGLERALYAPLYLSNSCFNCCRYCGYSYDNDIPRRELNLDEVSQEAATLKEMGIEQVLLLTGEAERIYGVDDLAQVIAHLLPAFQALSLEVFPMDTADYARLRDAGASGVTLYQETYDRRTYRWVHRKGRKRNMPWRLEAPARVLAAGFPQVGLGALLGLTPFRFEALALGLHLAELKKQFPEAKLSVSFPRLTEALGFQGPLFPVSDSELLHMMSALRLWMPELEFVLSTREPPALRDRLAPLLVNRLSAGSCTSPGGYAEAASSQAPQAQPQFRLADERPVSLVRDALRQRGLLVQKDLA